ncbi:MAG: diguanylate cyclase (GGDEF)-like protein [Oceanicoccus sp.]|jgi:diguanylate cyclase (GGDEF)-like protein
MTNPPPNDVLSFSPSVCPVGESQCVVIDQVLGLQQQVKQLSELARTDNLTGLANHGHFMQALEQEMERTRRTWQSMALLMIDLDHFKLVNDQWGHEAGNKALMSVAAVLKRTTRRLDIPCRYGGEEFAVILPSTDLLTAIQVAGRVRQDIEQTPVFIDGNQGEQGHRLSLTASLGVDVFTASQSDSPEQLITRTDHFMYLAKQQGRNQVCHASAELLRSDSAVSQDERDILSSFFGDDIDGSEDEQKFDKKD